MLSYTELRWPGQATLLGSAGYCIGRCAVTMGCLCSAGSAQVCIAVPGNGRCLCGPLDLVVACPPWRRQTTASLASHAAMTAQCCATCTCVDTCISSKLIYKHIWMAGPERFSCVASQQWTTRPAGSSGAGLTGGRAHELAAARRRLQLLEQGRLQLARPPRGLAAPSATLCRVDIIQSVNYC